ncbi:MAG: hypothetical protein ACYDBB_22055 [Armatimonadota bacterium]
MTDAINGTRISHADLLQLKRWNTPIIYNSWREIRRYHINFV